MQGLDLLRRMREQNDSVPIVVLSSRGDEAAKVEALDIGADDYVTKPFGMEELLARIRAALRHQLQTQGERPVFRAGELSVDLVRRIVKVGDNEIKLSPEGIRTAAPPGAARREGSDPQVPAQGAVGDADRCAVSARLCAPASPEDRKGLRAPAVHPHRDRHRLPAARAGLGKRGHCEERTRRSNLPLPFSLPRKRGEG